VPEIFFFQTFAAVIGTVLTVSGLWRNGKKTFPLGSFCLVITWWTLIAPVFLDVIFGTPDYTYWPGFFEASRDPLVTCVYAVAIVIIPLVFVMGRRYTDFEMFGRKEIGTLTKRVGEFGKNYQSLAAAILILPMAMFFFAPDFSFYAKYAIQSRNIRSQPSDVQWFHAMLQLACHVGVLASSLILVQSKRLLVTSLTVLPGMFFYAWIIGKRSGVAEIAALVFLAVLVRGKLSRAGLFSLAAGIALLFSLYSAWYQAAARGISVETVGWSEFYEGVRIDFFRDDTMKLAICRVVRADCSPILAFFGESVWIYSTLPIPRSSWPDKPISYGMSVACAARDYPRQQLSWSMTTSVFDEAVSNIGLSGIFLGPIMLNFLAWRGARTKNLELCLVTVVVLVLFMFQHLSAWMPIFLIWWVMTSTYPKTGSRRGKFAPQDPIPPPSTSTPKLVSTW
jgi:hypothetical protein